MSFRKVLIGIAALLLAQIGATGASAQLLINGAGATFPYPLYSKWFDIYTHVDPKVRFNYLSIGSGSGIRQIISHTVDFGASDAPMTDEQLKHAPAKLLHFPTVLGADVVTFNIPGFSAALRFSGPAIADIFMGKITRWNDPAIARLNPGVSLPSSSIVGCHRSDGSGTTFIFTDYLSKVSPDWLKKIGRGTAVKWPVGLGGKGNEGVTALIKQTPGSIGYVELTYALMNKLPLAELRNHDGRWVKPNMETVTAAATGAASNMPPDFRVSITNAPGAHAYPISSFTYLLVYQDQKDPARGRALVDFIKWALGQGQQYASPLAYAPLPPQVVSAALAQVDKIKLGESR